MKDNMLEVSMPSHHTEEVYAPGRLFLPSVVSSYFAAWPPSAIVAILLIDIGKTFKQPVGVMGQLQTIASLVTALTALLMSALSMRFNHKALLSMGLLSLCFSALGCFFALNYPMMLFTYSLYGLGLAVVEPMTFTLIGAHLPLKKRAHAIGWIMTGAALATMVGAPIAGVLTEIWSWRMAFFGFLFPISLLSLLLVMRAVPSHPQNHSHPQNDKESQKYEEGFRDVFGSRSALACLAGSSLMMASFQALGLYMISFFREHFLISIKSASILLIVASICYISGSQMGGHLANRFGRRSVTILMAIFTGILTIIYMSIDVLWLAVALRLIAGVFVGVEFTAAISLTLEQVPNVRGTMMSLNAAATYLGAALGAGIGGFTLLWLDYEGVGLVLGVLSLVAALIFFSLVIDPTNTKMQDSKT